jgi:GT2 family glycosyltransferase
MSNLIKNKATICIVNYKTLEFTRLCLRSIRKFTHYPYEVIVVDNNSQDKSLEYLKRIKWIRLIERDSCGDIGGGYSHGAGLQLGFENCNTGFFVSMHSDTFVIKDNWLTELISYFGEQNPQSGSMPDTPRLDSPVSARRGCSILDARNEPRVRSHESRATNIACVGSGKIELTPLWQQWLKKATDFRTFKRNLLNEPDPHGKYRYYNRTICCLYRTEVLREEGLSFLPERDRELTSGKKLYFELIDRGYRTVELPPKIMGQYIVHLAHATQVVNPQEFSLRKKTRKKCNRLVKKVFSSGIIQQILADDSLDN